MHIKSIVLDGFKSYGNRVEITGFDPEFNAITGLNGTGKSNILDSICFVLGITNLSNVRAGSLQELIYKHGQAGITKATVSITFDNRDKHQCPIGYENHDEITVTRQVVMGGKNKYLINGINVQNKRVSDLFCSVQLNVNNPHFLIMQGRITKVLNMKPPEVVMGGKNKYLINGINVQNKRVSDLFCSVQLNVNNPHFLIMQGRITKVLNMKPPEILSMVEEAAGTRMYEAKKQAAQKTIEKKDAKLRELNEIIREDIAPKLQKLQDERAQFQEYQKVVRELENVNRLYIAYRYVTASENLTQAQQKVQEVVQDMQRRRDEIQHNKDAAAALDGEIEELNTRLDAQTGSNLKQLEKELTALEKTEASASAAHKAAKEAVSTQAKRAKLLERALKDDEKALNDKKNILNEASATFEGLKAASEAAAAALAAAQATFLSVSTGREGAHESLQDQLMAAKQEASEASTSISQAQMEKRHAEDRLKTLEREFKASSAQFNKDQENIGRHQAQIDKLQAELSNMNFSEARNSELKDLIRQLQSGSVGKRDQLDRLSSRLQRCQFQYSAPTRDFDHSKVHGIVARLISVNDPVYCTALETAAGGKLYNVVVDTDETVDQLLKRGNIQTRTTMIPLNKITSYTIDDRTLKLAQQVGGGPQNVQRAVDLISFPPALAPAMGFVFGGTFVCRDADTANKVTFHPQIRKRCVTVEGDVYDPAGTLSGGARVKGGSVLVQTQQLQQLEQELAQSDAQLAQYQAELSAMQSAADAYSSKQQRFDMMSHELEVIKARLATTSHAQTHAEIESLRGRVAELARQLEEDKAKQQAAAARAKELEAKVRDIKGHREREFKKAEEALKKAKQDAEHHSSQWRQREQEFSTLQLEVQELENGVSTSARQLTETAAASEKLTEALQAAKEEHTSAENAVKEVLGRIKAIKAEIASRSGEIARLAAKKEQLAARNDEIQLRLQEMQLNVKQLETEAQDVQKKITALETEHNWIPGEKQYFGAAGGLYDFTARQANVAGQRLAQLKERKDRLARGLNARAHTLLGKEEEQYQDLLRKKVIVEADRAKLVQVMAELDEKKKRTLITACEQVNRDFGSIFSTLLPGAQARLKPPEGLTVLDGLEVKVGFNNTWKESLGELSGGQRSLVALSLILAMLRFKPAPLYILDEVDAALDLSHTQNIGHMLKEHFRNSQFIIVSLKDGMFNNANVLFRTRFVDGMSAVQRTVNNR